MKSLSHLLEEAEERITSMAQRPVRERLAESLLFLGCLFKTGQTQCDDPSDGVISLSREDIASIVGTATETVIRILSDFKEEKLIEIQGRKIKILNVPGLKKSLNPILDLASFTFYTA